MTLDIRQLTVGAIAENCFIVRREGSGKGLVIDPGEEPDRILAEIDDLGVKVEAILITHCHFDHIGAVAPVAKMTGATVYCPKIEAPVLADIMSFVPVPGLGPYESYEADVMVVGGETLDLAGLSIEVVFTPGHSPGHVTYSLPEDGAIFSGDVLFQGSVGRVDLPGGDGPTLMHSIRTLIETLPAETGVYPGHMGVTTLGAERATNPFIAQLSG